MSSLLIVRHGQASFFGADYDVLSSLGKEQSRLLGEVWAAREEPLDAVYVGPLRRHRETEEAFREGYTAGGAELAPAQEIPGLSEMEATALFAQAIARVGPSCPDLPQQLATGQVTPEGHEALRHMGGIVAKLIERWCQGEDVAEGMEPYAAFERRVVDALQRIMKAEQRGKRVAVFSSGGPICVGVKLALRLDAPRAMALMASITNASLTELRFREGQLTLGRFNVNHLPRAKHTRV